MAVATGAIWDQIVETVSFFIPEAGRRHSKYVSTPVQTHCSGPVIEVGAMSPFVRLAGLSGALAISLGAYGSHVIAEDQSIEFKRKRAFDAGSRYHLIHSLALLGAHKARSPMLTASLFTAGIMLFCGPCYHYSITGEESFRKFTPYGGILFIVGWLSFIL